MARKRKSRSKNRTPSNKALRGIVDARSTSKTQSRGKEAASKKCKTVSETYRSRSRRSNRLKRIKKVKSSSSVQLIRVQPCCSSEQDRKKYAKLGLDSALFLSSSKPAKRKQSHISVITISSSDDEDVDNDKTADWISKIDIGTINISSTEEPFPSGDADFTQNESMMEDILDAEKCRPQKSSLQIFSTPESTFKPLCASTPQEQPSMFHPACFSTLETEGDSLYMYKGPSFLENPATSLRQHLLSLKVSRNPHTSSSINQNQRDDEYKVKSVTSRSDSPKFYFGPPQNLSNEHKISENNEPTGPMLSDWSFFITGQTSNPNANTLKEVDRQEIEARIYSLEQVPSTSHAPVADPVLEVTPKKKKPKSRNSSTCK